LYDCPIVAKTAIPTSGAARIADVVLRFWDLLPITRKQKLLPHFGEPGTTVFAVEEIEYGGHDPSPCRLIVTTNSHVIISLGMQDVIWITARLCFSTTSDFTEMTSSIANCVSPVGAREIPFWAGW
jgi:hypothetical protein